MPKKIFLLLSFYIAITSCVPKKEVVYFQGNYSGSDQNIDSNFEPIIQKDDMLYINVMAGEPEAASLFNLDTRNSNDGLIGDVAVTTASGGNTFVKQKQTYLVDNQGNIDFPVIGTISVAGYSVSNLKLLIKEKLSLYIKNPIINVRIVNFKVSVVGEVNAPGTITCDSQRLTLIEALAKAGDLTIYGKRTNILVIRDIQGKKTSTRIDITKADFIDSPFYYLDQNDIVYVEPRKSKIDSATFGSNVGTVLSLVGLGLTLTLLITKL